MLGSGSFLASGSQLEDLDSRHKGNGKRAPDPVTTVLKEESKGPIQSSLKSAGVLPLTSVGFGSGY